MDTLLIVDDEDYIRQELGEILETEDRKIIFASNGLEAIEKLQQAPVDIILTDIRMPEMDGFGLIKKAKQNWPSLPIITITAFASTETAVEALRAGAYDYITKPFSVDEIRNIVSHALQGRKLFKEVNYLRGRLAQRYSMDNIIGQCPAMQRVFDTTTRVSSAMCNVLITGQSGTGKDLIAQAIHQNSPRKDAKFVPINCGSIPEGLLESELFGHVKGSFSGAVNDKEGLVQTANGGTLFLDEIGDMPLALQVKVLRLIQNKQVQKVGSTTQETVDVRIIAATHQNLQDQIETNTFRRDLYYRINVVEINIPPLSSRGGDISLLTSHFLKRYSSTLDKTVDTISPEVQRAFERYPWPGNVRELENALERAVTLSMGSVIEVEDLPPIITDYFNRKDTTSGTLQARLEKLESKCIIEAVEANNYDLNLTAEELGISLATLYRKLKKFNFPIGRKVIGLASQQQNTGKVEKFIGR